MFLNFHKMHQKKKILVSVSSKSCFQVGVDQINCDRKFEITVLFAWLHKTSGDFGEM